jgi:hypothetical protein
LKDETSQGEHYVAVQYVAESNAAGTITLSGDQGLAKLTVKTPTQNSHAATKKYVDDAKSACYSVNGGSLHGDIDLVGDGSAISGVIVFNNDAEANTPYIIADLPENDPGDNAKLRFGGVWDDTEVILEGIAEPRSNSHAATKKYVDDRALPIVSTSDNGKIPMVVNGKWQAVTLLYAEEEDF